MKIEFKRTPEQVALIKAMASNNKVEAAEAQEAFAAFLSPVLQEVLMHAGSAAGIYRDEPYDEDDSASFPIDTLYGHEYGDVTIWSQTVGGGLPTNELAGASEIKLRTYDLDSEISFEKRYARRARLNVVGRRRGTAPAGGLSAGGRAGPLPRRPRGPDPCAGRCRGRRLRRPPWRARSTPASRSAWRPPAWRDRRPWCARRSFRFWLLRGRWRWRWELCRSA